MECSLVGPGVAIANRCVRTVIGRSPWRSLTGACASTPVGRAATVPGARRTSQPLLSTGAVAPEPPSAGTVRPGSRADARRASVRVPACSVRRLRAGRHGAGAARHRRIATAAPIPQGFDCSGFTQYVFAQLRHRAAARRARSVSGGKVDRARGIWRQATSSSSPRPTPGASHVAHRDRRRRVRARAEFNRSGARRASRARAYWSPRFLGARR